MRLARTQAAPHLRDRNKNTRLLKQKSYSVLEEARVFKTNVSLWFFFLWHGAGRYSKTRTVVAYHERTFAILVLYVYDCTTPSNRGHNHSLSVVSVVVCCCLSRTQCWLLRVVCLGDGVLTELILFNNIITVFILLLCVMKITLIYFSNLYHCYSICFERESNWMIRTK